MAGKKVDQSSKAYKDALAAQKKKSAKRKPTVAGSIKAGVKAVGRAISGGGLADRAAKASQTHNRANKKALDL